MSSIVAVLRASPSVSILPFEMLNEKEARGLVHRDEEEMLVQDWY